MKTATYLCFACLLVNVSLQCETPTYAAMIKTMEGRPGGTLVKLRPKATTKWVNCLLSEYEDKLAEDRRDTSEDNLNAVNVGNLRMLGGRGPGRFVDLNLTNIIVARLSRPLIVSAEAEGMNHELTGKIRANIQYSSLIFKAGYQSAYHNTLYSPSILENCSGKFTVRTGTIIVEMTFDGRVTEKKPLELESMTIRLLSKPEELSLHHKMVDMGEKCGHAGYIFGLLKGSFVEDGRHSFRSKLRERLEAKLKRNLQLALEARKQNSV